MSSQDLVCYNGEIMPESEVKLSVNNRSFKYGDGIFETIRCFGNEPMLFDNHYRRLVRALTVLEMDLMSLPKREVLLKKIEQLINKSKFFVSSRIRLAVFRCDGGLYTPVSNKCEYLIEVSPIESNNYTLNNKGLIATVYNDVKKYPSVISPFKTANSMLFVLAGLYKKKMNASEVLILNTEGKIIETLASNLFWFKDDDLYTPSVSSGCVDGVMRKAVIDIAQREGIKVVEIPGVDYEELKDADELFTTNAIQGIQWIVGIDEKRFFNKKISEFYPIVKLRIREGV